MQNLSISSPLGTLRATANDKGIYSLEFTSVPQKIMGSSCPLLTQLQEELESYFKGDLKNFTVPLDPRGGTPFERQVWQALQKIPYGETWSYGELAAAIGRPTAFRAVANANGKNQLALLIPCHRVIQTGGALGGYGGGVARKVWLLNHEKAHR